jgi:hypothetical protein
MSTPGTLTTTVEPRSSVFTINTGFEAMNMLNKYSSNYKVYILI